MVTRHKGSWYFYLYTHTHTHSHTLFHYFSVYLSLTFCPCLIIFLSVFVSLTHYLHFLYLSLTLTHILSLTRYLSVSNFLCLWHTLSVSLTHTTHILHTHFHLHLLSSKEEKKRLWSSSVFVSLITTMASISPTLFKCFFVGLPHLATYTFLIFSMIEPE